MTAPLYVPDTWVAEWDLAVGGESVVHLVCCDPDRGLCGADVSTSDFLPDSDPAPECEDCIVIDTAGVPCGRPFCRLRQGWRKWRDR